MVQKAHSIIHDNSYPIGYLFVCDVWWQQHSDLHLAREKETRHFLSKCRITLKDEQLHLKDKLELKHIGAQQGYITQTACKAYHWLQVQRFFFF